MKLANVSKWEIAGVGAGPIVVALFALKVPALLGMTPEAFVEVLGGLMTAIAIVRAMVDARKGTPSDPEVLE